MYEIYILSSEYAFSSKNEIPFYGSKVSINNISLYFQSIFDIISFAISFSQLLHGDNFTVNVLSSC